MPVLATTYLLCLSVLWGAGFLFIRIAVAEIPPFLLAFVRIALAALVLAVVLRAQGQPVPRQFRPWRDYAIMGLLSNIIPFCLIGWAALHINSGLIAVLNAAAPVFVVVLSHLFSTERMTPNKAIGIALGFAGVAVLIGTDALLGLTDHLLPEIAVLAGCISYSLSGVWSWRFRGQPAITSAWCQMTASSLLILPVALIIDQPWTLPLPSVPAITAVVVLAVFSTALAYILFFQITTLAGPTATSLVTFLTPPIAIFLGWAVLGEHLAPQHFAGTLLIAVGFAAIDGRVLAWMRGKVR